MDEQSVFALALDKSSAVERDAFLDEVCAGDPELRAGVEALLRAHEKPDSFLEAGGVSLPRTIEAPAVTERPGTLIGPYKLLEQIGEGGMGLVFVAEQQQPVRRKVALKLIKPGMDSRQVIARFEAERQTLALMNHPNIAKVFDGGTTGGELGGVSAGRPYFVMELVKGTPITAYCDQHQLPTRARLELFLEVCQAVQHAHQKGIIHRDLKPSNILVEIHDVRPVVKIIDFGIAKAIGQQLSEKTLYTGIAQMIGTPLYMSPEQAGLSSLDVDTRSDVYSLGVLLYELLTGSTPFDGEALKKAGYDEMRRIIREDEPAKPSTRLSTLGKGALSTISGRRGADPRKLRIEVRGELDLIVMKTLEKDRNRRYESASALAADVHRYLQDEPVLACPPSRRYRLGKFLRKHRRGVLTAAALLAAALVLGAGIGWVALDRAAQRAVTEQTTTENLRLVGEQRDLAQDRAQTLRRFLYAADMRLAHDVSEKGDFERVREILAKYEPRQGEEDLRSFIWRYLRRLCEYPQPRIFTGHRGTTYCVAYSPDGRELASAGMDGTVRLWDAASGAQKRVIRVSELEANCVAYSPDGETLATAADDGLIKLWDRTTGHEVAVLRGHEGEAVAVAFSPDGRLLASGGDDHVIRLWETRQGSVAVAHRLEGHAGRLESLAFSPDGKTLASVGGSGHLGGHVERSSLFVWDVAGQFRKYEIKRPLTYARCLAFSHDGLRLALPGDSGIEILAVHDGRLEAASISGHILEVESLAFSPDDSVLASVGREGHVFLRDRVAGKVFRSFGALPSGSWCAAFQPNGKSLAATTGDGSVLSWELGGARPGQILHSFDQRALWTDLMLAPDGLTLAGFSKHGLSGVWDIAGRRWIAPLATRQDSLRCTIRGGHLVRIDDDNTLRVWDLESGKSSYAIAPDSGTRVRPRLSPSGKIASVNNGKEVQLWRLESGRKIASLVHPTEAIRCVEFSPDERTVVAGMKNGDVRLWDMATATVRQEIPRQSSQIGAFAFSAAGDLLFICVEPAAPLKIWNTNTGQEQLRLAGQAEAIQSAAFSPDGRTLATASDGTIKLWDIPTGRELLAWTTPRALASLAFTLDGAALVWAGRTRTGAATVRRWSAEPLDAPLVAK